MKHHPRWRAATVALAVVLPLSLLSGDLRAGSHPEPVAVLDGFVAFEAGPSGPRLVEHDRAGIPVPGRSVDLSLAGCRVTNRAAIDELLVIATSPVDPDMFIVDNGVGFRTTSGNCSKSNGRISVGETMIIQAPPGRTFVSARLNVEGKFDADLRYAVGDAPVAAADLTANPVMAPVVHQPLTSDTGDNGPDSGTNDNTVFTITADEPFTTITLTPTGDPRAQISLENGGDGADPDSTESRFYYGRTYDFGVDCGDEVVLDGPLGSTLDRVTFRRGENKDGLCEPIGLDIDFESLLEQDRPRSGVDIDPSLVSVLGNEQQVRARVSITWVVPRHDESGPRSAADIDLELARQIQYPGLAPQSLSYCASADLAVGAGAEPDRMNVADYDVVSPDDQPVDPAWCLLVDERVLDGDTIVQTIVLDVGGDPLFF